MISRDPDDGLFDLVGSIDDDRPIDWEGAERAARTEADLATIRELKILSEIARVYRDPDGVVPVDAEDGSALPTAAAAVPRTWGQLRILDILGQGAFSTVYRARDRIDREVALKLLSPGMPAGERDRRRILREGRLLGRLSHPNIVAVLGADVVDQQVGLWMELVRGVTLEDELAAHGPRGAREATLIGLELCRALAAVHGAGLLHRDVKAQNVMREQGGRIVLMDLGASVDVADLAREPAARTRGMAGTPLYLAPEIFDHQPATIASDVYSLGVLLYHIVSGAFPVDGATLADVEQAHRRREHRRLRDVRADLPDAFVRVVERALAPTRDERYRSAGDFEAALANLLPQAGPAPPARLGWWTVAAAAVAAAAVAVLWASLPGPRADGPVRVAAGESAPAAASERYTVEAAFHKWNGPGEEVRLANEARVAVGDELLLTVRASRPVYAYVYNEDAEGRRYALYPLDEDGFARPLEAGRLHRLPGVRDGDEIHWSVSNSGRREGFTVSISPERDAGLEAWLRTLPRPTSEDALPPAGLREPNDRALRGAGRLTARPPRPADLSPSPFPDAPPLGSAPETATGMWVRRLTLANP